MKHFVVDVDITMSCRIEVDAESEEQAKTIVGNWIGDNPWQYVRDGHYISHEFEDVNEAEQEPTEPLTFKELCDKLQYFSVNNNQQKTIGEICDECREYIRKAGHDCLDDGFDSDADAKEWMQEHHPDLATDDIEETTVTYGPLEFLCEDEYSGDVYFAEMHITFYGDFDNGVGVFSVTNG